MEGGEDEVLIKNVEIEIKSERRSFRKYAMETSLLVVFFGWILGSTIIQNQLLEQTCLSFGYNASECSTLGENNVTKEIEEEIQPEVATINMVTNLINSIIPAVVTLFVGPWSDKFGRKKVICASFVGYSLSLTSFSVISFIADHQRVIDPWIYVLPNIPIILTGGWPTMVSAIFSYATDKSNDANRSSRLAIIDMMITFGFFTGTASSSFILELTSATTVFIISTICVTLATVYGIIFIDESVKVTNDLSTFGMIRELFTTAPVKEMLGTCFKPRPLNERRILGSLLAIIISTIFILSGLGNVFYLFVRRAFQWTLKDYTTYESATLLVSTFGGIIGITVLKKLLKFSDCSLAVVAIVSKLLDAIIKGFAVAPYEMYLASGLCLFRILLLPMCRSLISTVIPGTEIGKIYSLMTSVEAVSSLIASPLYTFVYTSTFTFFPGAFYMITVVVCVINLFLIYCASRMLKTRETLLNLYAPIN